mmetsp:Transcript_105604/g.209828  ORF Transcript_105604/g.209828 Transcript_105604/m.209828 type:complete len:228 (-) Transcript_105604:10-693(-)
MLRPSSSINRPISSSAAQRRATCGKGRGSVAVRSMPSNNSCATSSRPRSCSAAGHSAGKCTAVWSDATSSVSGSNRLQEWHASITCLRSTRGAAEKSQLAKSTQPMRPSPSLRRSARSNTIAMCASGKPASASSSFSSTSLIVPSRCSHTCEWAPRSVSHSRTNACSSAVSACSAVAGMSSSTAPSPPAAARMLSAGPVAVRPTSGVLWPVETMPISRDSQHPGQSA